MTRFILMPLMTICACLITGCISPSQETMKKPSLSAQQPISTQSLEKSTDEILLKPVIPPEPELGSGAETTRQVQSQIVQTKTLTDSPNSDQTPKRSGQSPETASIEAEPKTPSKAWEDEKVKSLALDLAKGSSAGSKMKICYAIKRDEWWVILYENIGSAFEVKQYSWNREQNKLEPFLVYKTLPHDKIQEQLNSPEPDRACEVVETPPKED